MTQKRFQFDVERLDVFRASLEFVRYVSRLKRVAIQGDRRQQLLRAADSIALNIAEGVGRGPGKARRNFHRIAFGSASECVAILMILEARGDEVAEGREILSKIGAMLCRLIAGHD